MSRLKSDLKYRVQHCLSKGTHYHDELIELGKPSNPCQFTLRLVSVRWGTSWYRYLTNVTDPQRLVPRQVCELYRERWKIESAFCSTKRLLGLSYFWVGQANGIRIQIYATWIFYAVLNDLCSELARALSEPLERISLEMVFRSLYHYAHACLKHPELALLDFLVEHHRSLGLLKARRKRDRLKESRLLDIWSPVLT